MALTLPFMLLLFGIAVDYARVYQYVQTLQVCARNGAIYASDPVIAQSSPYETIDDAALAQAGPLRPEITIETAENLGEANPSVTVTARCTFRTITGMPGLPREVELSESQCMRLPRSLLESEEDEL